MFNFDKLQIFVPSFFCALSLSLRNNNFSESKTREFFYSPIKRRDCFYCTSEGNLSYKYRMSEWNIFARGENSCSECEISSRLRNTHSSPNICEYIITLKSSICIFGKNSDNQIELSRCDSSAGTFWVSKFCVRSKGFYFNKNWTRSFESDSKGRSS